MTTINTDDYSATKLFEEIDRILRNAGSHWDGYITLKPYDLHRHLGIIRGIMRSRPGQIFMTQTDDHEVTLIYPGQGMSVEYITSKVMGKEFHDHPRCPKCKSDLYTHNDECYNCGWKDTSKSDKRLGILEGMLDIYGMLTEYSDGDEMKVEWENDKFIVVKISQYESVGSKHPEESSYFDNFDSAKAFIQGLIIAAVHAKIRAMWDNQYGCNG
jgi:hypothetical protein